MEHPFMKTIYAKRFDATAYAHYLAGQLFVFRELEGLCSTHMSEAPLAAVYDTKLCRSSALAADLRFWCRAAGQDLSAAPSPATAAYLEQLRADGGHPWLLLCHHFLQYNAVLSGGQFLGRLVGEAAQEKGWAAAGAAGDGAAFYTFDQERQPAHARVQRYLDDVDALDIAPALRDQMLECMRRIYRLLLAMLDEVYQLAPLPGASYEASRAAGTGPSSAPANTAGATGAAGSKIPPPPMEPASRDVTLEELHKHCDGPQLLTSVLGRIYDVTIAPDLFGPGGPYTMFSGHDGTFNLAVMSLKKVTLDKFDYQLDDDDKECLADWIAYFDNRYGRPVGRLSDRRHPVGVKDLPRATKIPFSGISDGGDAAQEAKSKL